MAYTNAIFYLDYVNGNDAARSDLVPTAYADNGSGLVRVTVSANTLVTGAIVDIAGTTGSVYVGAWKITVIDSTHFDLQGSTYTSNPAAKGTCIPRGGDSWANAWKTKSTGATSARVAAGDTIRTAKSADPTSLGVNATWTKNTLAGGIYATKTVSATANNGSGLVRITTSTAHGYSTGDIVQVLGIVGTVEANGAWKITVISSTQFDLQNSAYASARVSGGTTAVINSKAVVLSTPLTKNVTDCELIWTGANDGTASLVAYTTDAKEGGNCTKITMDAATQANKLQAYKALGAVTDFSAYQELSFWFKNSAIIDNTTWYLALCSDTAGATVVDTFPITRDLSSINFWNCRSIPRTGGGNLGSSIQSIALYSGATAPANSSNIMLDNIIACATGSLNLTTLIGKNQHTQTGTDGWYTIQSITPYGDIILLDNGVQKKSNEGRGYSGTTETVTLYQRETIKILTGHDQISRNGVNGSRVTISGGWNTASTTQDGMTYLDSLGGNYDVNFFASAFGDSYVTFEYTGTARGDVGFYCPSGVFCEVNNCVVTGCNAHGIYYNGLANNQVNNCYFSVNNGQHGIHFLSANVAIFNNIYNCSNNGDVNGTGGGLSFSQAGTINGRGVCKLWNNYNAITLSYAGDSDRSLIENVDIYGSRIATFQVNGGCYFNILNATISEAYAPITNNQSLGQNSQVTVNNLNSTGYSKIYMAYGSVESQASTLTHGTGKEWKFTNYTTARYLNDPLKLPIAYIAVTANNLVTVKGWFKKGNATTIGAKLVCPGGQIAGVASDVVATKADDTSEEELSITFTPTENGVVVIEAWAYYISGFSTVIVDNLTITQA